MRPPRLSLSTVVTRLRELFGADLRSLALLRISLGLLIIADLVDRARDLRAHYTDWGLLPRGPLLTKFMNWACVSLHVMGGTWGVVAALFIVQACVALLLIVGWRTRLMTVLSWFLMYSLHLRNPMVLQGGDDLLRMLIFWSMFVPLGARYSVDAAMARNDPTQPFQPPKSLLCSIGTAALVVQILLLYWCTALLKTGAEWHEEATAVYFALNYDQLATATGVWLRQFTDVLPWLTRATINFETFGPFLLVWPFWGFGAVRTAGAFLFMGMHHGFAMCLILGLFPWIDTASMLMLLPDWFWNRASRHIDRDAQARVTIYFDDGCEVCRKIVLIITEFLLVQWVRCEAVTQTHALRQAMDTHRSWLVQDPEGLHHGFEAFVALCRVSPLCRPFVKLLGYPLVSRWGNFNYRNFADNRPALARFLRGLHRGEPIAYPGRTSQAACALFLYMIIAWNIAGLPQLRTFRIAFSINLADKRLVINEPVGFPDFLRPLAYAMRLDQDWGMFAPYPSKEDGWYVTEGKLGDGRLVDVYARSETAPSWDKPELVSAMYKNQRWSKYFMNIWLARNNDYRLYLGQWLCRYWNGEKPYAADRLTTFDITYVREDTLSDGKVGEPKRVNLWSHRCYDVTPTNPPIHIPEPPRPAPVSTPTPTPPVADPNKGQPPIVAPDPNAKFGRHE